MSPTECREHKERHVNFSNVPGRTKVPFPIFNMRKRFLTLLSYTLLGLSSFYGIVEGERELDEDEGTPFNAFLSQNHTKVPLRKSCNNVTAFCSGEYVECVGGYCKCIAGFAAKPTAPDLCGERIHYNVDIQTDPTMIGVVIGLALMSVTLCVVLRLFAKARFRENRTIFNTANPRLMNVSLMKGGSKHFLRGNSATASARRASETSVTSVENPRSVTPAINPSTPRNDTTGDETRIVGIGSRVKTIRSQMSIDTTTGADTPTTSSGSAPRFQKSKYRQDSVTSNSNV